MTSGNALGVVRRAAREIFRKIDMHSTRGPRTVTFVPNPRQIWTVERSSGPAGPFHQRTFADLETPTVWVHHVEAPALVLGSTTDNAIVKTERADKLGIEICRRRSGGGLVLVEPGRSCWIDVLLPRDDSRWDEDVNRSFGWVGTTWAAALASLGVANPAVHQGSLIGREFGRALCFAGIGPGEVTVPIADEQTKVVGISQRRTKAGARFQGLYVSSWSPTLLADLLNVGSLPHGLDIAALKIGLGADAPSPADVEAAFLARL